MGKNKRINLRYSSKLIITNLICVLLLSCESNAPKKENTPEVITKITLTFTPTDESGEVVVSATDADNDGPKDIQTDGAIQLAPETTYQLSISLINGLHKPGEDGYSVTEEIEEEGDEHQFFYAWTQGLFTDPTKDGNIDKSGTVNYVDKDENGLPIGLKTTWTTGGANSDSNNTFRILLQHQPDIKSQNSSSKDGESDVDISFEILIQ